MLLEFSIKNYKMFSNDALLCMIKEGRSSNELRNSRLFEYVAIDNEGKEHLTRINPLGIIYGQNGSGKTSLLLALPNLFYFMGIKQGGMQNPFGQFKAESFFADKREADKPINFYISTLDEVSNLIFEYSIDIDVNNGGLYFGNEKLRVAELKVKTNSKRYVNENNFKNIFFRENNYIDSDFNELSEYINAIQLQDTGIESSVLQKVININQEKFTEYRDSNLRKKVNSFIETCLTIKTDRKFEPHNIPDTVYMHNPSVDPEYKSLINMLKELPSFKADLIKAFYAVDTGITDIIIKTVEDEKYVLFSHGQGDNKILVQFDDESDGTRKFIYQFMRMYKSIEKHGVFIVDELENNYHPEIQKYLINLFVENKSQLIFTTHNTELMNYDNIPIESIMFVDKNPETNNAEVYQLVDFEGNLNRSKYNIRKMYEQGRLGAFPRIVEV
ncbi:AAA family ATPase [Weissella paramesenteroides]